MAFNGSGTFNRLYSWASDAANNVNISSSRMDGEDNGFAAGLSNCITRDGQSPWLANIPAGGFKITGLANGSAATDSIAYGQITASTGAALMGAATGGTVEDAIWKKGRAAAIAGSKMAIRWLRDDATFPLENEASIWSGAVVTDHGISATFGAGDGQANSPCAGLFVMANNNGSAGDVCGIVFTSVARVDNAKVFGANIIAQGAGKAGCKFVGLEIDVEPTLTDTAISTASGGLYINAFNVPIPGPAMMVGGVGGGTFNNGIVLGGLATSAAGLSLQSAASANSLINTTAGTYTNVAVLLGNGLSRGIRLSGTAAAHAFIYNDGTNNVRQVLGSGSWIWRDNTDTTSLIAIDSGGNLDLANGGVLRVSGTQVVRARDTGWTAMTGSPDKATSYATSTVTLAQLAGRVMSIQAALTAHGLLGA